jgi:hypothetical protein
VRLRRPGEDVDETRESCNEKADADEACEIDYEALNVCIDKLDDACSYATDCGQYIESAYYHCG